MISAGRGDLIFRVSIVGYLYTPAIQHDSDKSVDDMMTSHMVCRYDLSSLTKNKKNHRGMSVTS